ncbi:MAG: DoxX family membrane protein [Chlamydiae bacterium]|nr:DoxX family membrane protein [Chlamydiota bacterium]
MQSIFAFIGRLFLSGIFIFTAMQDIIQWNSQEEFAFTTLTTMLQSGSGNRFILDAIAVIVPKLSIFFAAAVFLKLLGGICVLFQWKARFGAFLLLLFLIPVTVIIHNFWDKTGLARVEELVQFWKNIGIAGGLFLLLAYNSSGNNNFNKAEGGAKKA